MNKEELQTANDQLREELVKLNAALETAANSLTAETHRAGELEKRLESLTEENIQAHRAVEILTEAKREGEEQFRKLHDEVSRLKAPFPAEEVERVILAKIQGADIQRLFHNPTAPAMRQAAALVTSALKHRSR